MDLRHLTDQSLLKDIKVLVARERVMSMQVIHHLREIEKRRLYADLKYGSLFEYAVKELGYAEASAMRRINAARLIKDLPDIETKILSGALSLTNLSLANQLFKNENIKDLSARKEILKEIENSSKKECEQKLSSFVTPKPNLIPPVYGINFNLSAKTMDELKELRDLLAHKRWRQDQLISFAIKAAIEKIKRELVEPTPPAEAPCNNRSVPRNLKSYIFKRDKRCVKCGSTFKLEIDHIKPFSLGGKTSKDNLRLLCRSCNQRARIKAGL